MDNILIKLKRLLNSIDDDELEDIDLWIDNTDNIQGIMLDDASIVLITDVKKLTFDGKEW